jgi:hypothetical protein
VSGWLVINGALSLLGLYAINSRDADKTDVFIGNVISFIVFVPRKKQIRRQTLKHLKLHAGHFNDAVGSLHIL